MEDDRALVRHLPDRAIVVGVAPHVDLHVQLLVKQRRVRANLHGDARRRHRDGEVACRRAVRYLDLDEDHADGLPPVVALGDAAEALGQQPLALHVVPQRLLLLRPPLHLLRPDALRHERRRLIRALLVRQVVAGLVVGQRLLVRVEPERVARRRDALAVNVLVEVPVVHHHVVPSSGEPRAPLDLAVGPAALADRLACLLQLLLVAHLLALLLGQLLAAVRRERLEVRVVLGLKGGPRFVALGRTLVQIVPAELRRILREHWRWLERGGAALCALEQDLRAPSSLRRVVPPDWLLNLATEGEEGVGIIASHSHAVAALAGARATASEGLATPAQVS
mmetsp:Transcript_50239/g.132263  ORF Transcript_50239/g.132263 Transcript_50239/m.132263 type:complete len:337 (+) Transcript_50239:1101-2111(+)